MAARQVNIDLTGNTGDLKARLAAAKFVLAERERELLELKGPCSTRSCSLHYAHSGPCRIPLVEVAK